MARRPAAEIVAGLIAAALTAWLFIGAAAALPPRAGVSTFGRPLELALAWVVAGLAGAWWLLRAPDRIALARRLLLVCVTTTLLGHRGVPGDSGVRLALVATLLLVARPLLVPGRAALVTVAALLLAVPAMLGTHFPQGSVLWLGYVLPPASLALLVPALFPGRAAERVVWVLLGGTALLCAFALGSYLVLAHGLELPLRSVLDTRLRLLGLHPNLAAPYLVTATVLGLSLLRSLRARERLLAALLLAPVLLALYAVHSRTGWLALGFGAGAFALGLLPTLLPSRPLAGLLSRTLLRLAAVGVAALLLWPVFGGGEGFTLRPDPSAVGKAVSFRASMWALGRDAWQAAPWYGFGPGTAYEQARFARPGDHEGLPKDDHPHNVVLAVGGALGWPGLLGLALLFGLGIGRLRTGEPIALAAGAALLALWAANAIDLGGADATLYPALAFLLLGLREAADTDAPATRAAERAGRLGARLTLAAALAVLLLGASLTLGDLCERRALAALQALEDGRLPPLPADAAPRSSEHASDAARWLARARRLQPFDPNLPLLQARLANLQQRPADTLAALLEARRLFPGSATLAHQAALVLSAQDARDPRVDLWLAEAVRADPYGPESWRRHLDRAALADGRGRREEALSELLATALLHPGALRPLARSGSGETLTLHPQGPGSAGVPVAALLAAIAELRESRTATGPDEAARLRLRTIEVLQALDEHAAADAAARELLADNPKYLEIRMAQSCLAQGRLEEAIEGLRRMAPLEIFTAEVALLDALSRGTPPDRAAFGAQLEVALDHLARGLDVVFEISMVESLIEARLRCAEHEADLSLASRFSDALDFARR